jgi:hypothetical protein
MGISMRSTRRILAGAVALALGSAASLATAQVQSRQHDGGAIHFFFTPSYQQRTGRVPELGTGEMEYFGGTVFSQVEVVSVIWGSGVNATTVAEIPDFSAAIVNSTFIDQLGEYSTKHVKTVNGHKGSHQSISRGTFFGQVQITPKNQKTTITNKEVWKELQYQIAQGNLPPQGPNVLYMIYFPTNITIEAFGLTSCQAFGAYHFASSKKETPTNIFYAVEPDCNSGFDFITYAASHEFAEATTDNIGTPGTNPRFPQAWNNSGGEEIGDLCEGDSGTLTDATRSYQITQVYLNSLAGCSTGNYSSP